MGFVQIISKSELFRQQIRQLAQTQEKNQYFVSGSLKDGLRNLSKNPIDLLLVDFGLPEVQDLRWLKKLALESDLKNGEQGVALLATTGQVSETSLQQLLQEPDQLQDIFWLSPTPEQLPAISFFIEKNLRFLEQKRLNYLLRLGQNSRQNLSERPRGAPLFSPLAENLFFSQPDSAPLVLLLGEEGLQQSEIALAWHQSLSSRPAGFSRLDFKTTPPAVQEQRLFGYHAPLVNESVEGILESRGTVFLENIEAMSWELQGKFFHCLSEGVFSPCGSEKKLTMPAHIILSASPRLTNQMEAGTFRQDLYYRIKLFPLVLAPVREQRDQLESFCRHYLQHLGLSPSLLTEEILQKILERSWPGNVPELEAYLASLPDQKPASPSRPALAFVREDNPAQMQLFLAEERLETLEAIEEKYIRNVMHLHRGNVSEAARTLGISRKTLYTKLKKFGMEEAKTS